MKYVFTTLLLTLLTAPYVMAGVKADGGASLVRSIDAEGSGSKAKIELGHTVNVNYIEKYSSEFDNLDSSLMKALDDKCNQAGYCDPRVRAENIEVTKIVQDGNSGLDDSVVPVMDDKSESNVEDKSISDVIDMLGSRVESMTTEELIAVLDEQLDMMTSEDLINVLGGHEQLEYMTIEDAVGTFKYQVDEQGEVDCTAEENKYRYDLC